MTNLELERMLRNNPPPEWPEEHWAAFPQEVIRRLPPVGREPGTIKLPQPPWAWAFAAALVTALLAMLGLWWGPRSSRANGDPLPVAASTRLIQELNDLFPGRIRAVIMEGPNSTIVLSEQPAAHGSEPVLVRLRRNGDSLVIVTFSGQSVDLGPQRFEVLADGARGVLLVGEDFVWSSGGPAHLPPWTRVEARTLGEVL
jgi:hypothetical protein